MFKKLKEIVELCGFMWLCYVFLVPAFRGLHGYFQEHPTFSGVFSLFAVGTLIALARHTELARQEA